MGRKFVRPWNDYKEHIKSVDDFAKADLEVIETTAAIISAMIKQRNALVMSQRELAELCGMPQSSVARIESYKTTPNLETVMKILKPLGLQLSVGAIR